MSAEFPLIVSLLVTSLAISFLLSGMEAGLFALSPFRIRQQMRAGKSRAGVLHRYLEHTEDFLWTILIGNTLANFVALALAAYAFSKASKSLPFVLGGLLAGGLSLYFLCELLPKTLFRLYPNRLCLNLVWAFRLIHFLLSPLVGIIHWTANHLLQWTGGRATTAQFFGSREELRVFTEESAHAFSSEERLMISRALELQTASVVHILIPMTRVTTVTSDTPLQAVVDLCRERNLTWLPVWEARGDQLKIAGTISLNSILYDPTWQTEKKARDLLQPALFLRQEVRLEQAMRRMQKTGQRLAIILGNEERELGIVSFHDILRFLFGQLKL